MIPFINMVYNEKFEKSWLHFFIRNDQYKGLERL